jgi:protocatechuate 4,5-dioxygenase beta chain
MLFVRPEMDIPIVPILTNCIAPPLPRPKRFYEVGKALRAAIDSLPTSKRVGVLVSGHLSLEVGGPKQFERKLQDPEFDGNAVGWIENGDIQSAVDFCTPERMLRAGNMTMGFLNFLMMMGVANNSKPGSATERVSKFQGSDDGSKDFNDGIHFSLYRGVGRQDPACHDAVCHQ